MSNLTPEEKIEYINKIQSGEARKKDSFCNKCQCPYEWEHKDYQGTPVDDGYYCVCVIYEDDYPNE